MAEVLVPEDVLRVPDAVAAERVPAVVVLLVGDVNVAERVPDVDVLLVPEVVAADLGVAVAVVLRVPVVVARVPAVTDAAVDLVPLVGEAVLVPVCSDRVEASSYLLRAPLFLTANERVGYCCS